MIYIFSGTCPLYHLISIKLANKTPKSSKKAPNMYTYGEYTQIIHTRKHREGNISLF